jgi:hypothetical protein
MITNTPSTAQQRADRQRQKLLGNALKRLYAGAVAEPVPEEFLLPFIEMDRKRPLESAAQPLCPR